MQVFAAALPVMRFSRLRTRLYRFGGLSIGHGTVILGKQYFTGEGIPADRLTIGSNCILNESITFNLGEHVTIEDNVGIGMQCLFLTVSHRIGDATYRTGRPEPAPVRVQKGAWLGARVVVLPGVTIGGGAVVGAGAVVTKNVPPNVLAGGVPARILRTLEPNGEFEA